MTMQSITALNATQIRPAASSLVREPSLPIKAAAINIVNWRLAMLGRNKFGPAEIRVAELIEKALNEIGARLEDAVEADMTSADPAPSVASSAVDDAVKAFAPPVAA